MLQIRRTFGARSGLRGGERRRRLLLAGLLLRDDGLLDVGHVDAVAVRELLCARQNVAL